MSGSLTKLTDGVTPYLVAGTGILISTGSNGQVAVASTATGGGSAYYNVTGSYNALVTDRIMGVNTSLGAFTITLPTGSLITAGADFIVKDEYGLANSNNITITAQGTDTIDTGTSSIINLTMGSRSFYYAGSGKFYQW